MKDGSTPPISEPISELFSERISQRRASWPALTVSASPELSPRVRVLLADLVALIHGSEADLGTLTLPRWGAL